MPSTCVVWPSKLRSLSHRKTWSFSWAFYYFLVELCFHLKMIKLANKCLKLEAFASLFFEVPGKFSSLLSKKLSIRDKVLICQFKTISHKYQYTYGYSNLEKRSSSKPDTRNTFITVRLLLRIQLPKQAKWLICTFCWDKNECSMRSKLSASSCKVAISSKMLPYFSR